MYDLTLIKTNKDEAISLSKKLGFSDIFFIQNEDIIKNIKEIRKNKFNLVLGGNDELNRAILTNKSTSILLNPEPNTKDSIKQKNSGLNDVLCNLANKNKIAVAFSIDRLKDLNLLGKILQNIKLCKKYKVKMLFFTLARHKYDLVASSDMLSTLYVLGLQPREAKYALTGINEIIKGKSL